MDELEPSKVGEKYRLSIIRDWSVVLFYNNDLKVIPRQQIHGPDSFTIYYILEIAPFPRRLGTEFMHRLFLQVLAVIIIYNLFINLIE